MLDPAQASPVDLAPRSPDRNVANPICELDDVIVPVGA
jgi:hypothetical protein